MKTKNVWLLLLALVVIALELQPTGAVLRFGNPGGEPFRETFSYFSLVPFGYANFAPLLTAVTSVILTVILVLELLFDRRGLRRTALVLSFVSLLLSLGPILYGFSNYSVVGAGISLFLGAIFAGCFIRERRT